MLPEVLACGDASYLCTDNLLQSLPSHMRAYEGI